MSLGFSTACWSLMGMKEESCWIWKNVYVRVFVAVMEMGCDTSPTSRRNISCHDWLIRKIALIALEAM